MKGLFFSILISSSLFYSCNPTKRIQASIVKKDTVAVEVTVPNDQAHKDSLQFMALTYQTIRNHYIRCSTFAGKIDVDYEDGEGKKHNVNAHLRMYRDSVIWISVTGMLGMEGIRIYISKDSVKMLDKQNKIYTVRSIPYLQELTSLPLTLSILQDLFLGNPVFLDPDILSYKKTEHSITLQSNDEVFKNLYTVRAKDHLAESSKLDDIDPQRNRTCYLTYSDYEDKKGIFFSTKRKIQVSEKKKLEVKLDFKQFDFNEKLSFPFPVTKNYERN